MNTSDVSPTSGNSPSVATNKPPLSQTARETVAQVKDAARSTLSQASDSAAKIASEKKTSAADRVEAYGTAIHESARSLEQQDPNIAWLTHQAADRLQRVATYVRERDFQDLKADAENLARRHPAAFFGGMCVAGLILGSVIKASASGARDGETSDDDTSAASEGDSAYRQFAGEGAMQSAEI